MYLVTGSTGFIGKALVKHLRSRNERVKVVRRDTQQFQDEDTYFLTAIDANTNWSALLDGVTVVIHCAARAHRMNDPEDSFEKYKSINTDGTLCLAKACITAGVRRFVFVSTIKVCGDRTERGMRFSPDSLYAPTDWYSQTKADAELGLIELARKSNLELVIVRPPIVYGPGAKGNLRTLVKLVSMRIPIPLGAVHNKRSLIGLENLIDFLITSSRHHNANGLIFNVSEGEPLSTGQVIQLVANALNKRAILLPVPVGLLILIGKITGKTAYVDRLISNMEVDSSNCFKALDWNPPAEINQSVASLVGKTD